MRTVAALMRSSTEIALLASPRASKMTISPSRCESSPGKEKWRARCDARHERCCGSDGKLAEELRAVFARGLGGYSQPPRRYFVRLPGQYTDEHLALSSRETDDQ